MFKSFVSAIVLATSFATSATAASITGYSSEANYNSAVDADTVFLDFGGLFGIIDGDFTGVDFYTARVGADSSNVLANAYIGDAGDPGSVNNVGRIGGVLDTPSFALGMTIISSGGPGQINLYDSANAFVGGVGYLGNGFVGVVTDMAFNRFEITPTLFDPGQYDRIFVDNFRVSTPMTPVPLPATGLLLATAVGGLALRRRRS